MINGNPTELFPRINPKQPTSPKNQLRTAVFRYTRKSADGKSVYEDDDGYLSETIPTVKGQRK